MNIRRIFAVLSSLLVAGCFSTFAQTGNGDTGFTPYSIFGLGDLSRPGTAYNLSMGGIGIGDRNASVINVVNPASITEREQKSFMMDFGLGNQNSVYTQGNLKSAHNSFNMRDIVATMPITRKSAFKVGIAPYSTISYKFINEEKDEDVLANVGDVEFADYGEGSIYQAVLGGAVTLFDRLSIGVDGQYYFGNISRHTDAVFTTSSYYNNITAGWNYLVSSFSAKFGLQYSQPLGKRHEAVIGATYSLGNNIGGRRTRYVYGVNESKTDTLFHSLQNMDAFNIPAEIGVGITVREKNKWMVGFDYVTQDWSKSTFESTPGINFTTARLQSFRAGFEFIPNRYDIRYYVKRITYRGGVYHEKSYMCLDGNQISSTGITLGASFPLSPTLFNAISVGVDLGQRGSSKGNLVKERYVLVNVSFNIHDIWFLKHLYN